MNHQQLQRDGKAKDSTKYCGIFTYVHIVKSLH